MSKSLSDRAESPRDEDDFTHYFNATRRLSAERDRLRAENEALKAAIVAIGAAWQRGEDAEIGTAIGAALALDEQEATA